MNPKNTISSFSSLAWCTIAISIILIALLVAGLLISNSQNLIFFEKINLITVASFLIFIASASIASVRTSWFLFLLPFHLLAFPSAVNNLLPGIFLGNAAERGAVIVPYFYFMDIILVIGIIRAIALKFELNLALLKKYIPLLLLFSVLLVVQFLTTSNIEAMSMIGQGTFQLRILLFIVLIGISYPIEQNQKLILHGMAFAVVFLLFESSMFSFISGSSRLISGSLATNTFANITAALLVLFILSYRFFNSKKLFWLLLLSCIAIIIFSQTRMAILALIFGLITSVILTGKIKKYITWSPVILFSIIGLAYLLSNNSGIIPSRYQPQSMIENIEFSNPIKYPMDHWVEINFSESTSSLITRKELYRTSFRMIADHPFIGIGPSTWNYYKQKYGFQEAVFIDAHNGYLAVLSQYGILGIYLLYLLLWKPHKMLKSKNRNNRILWGSVALVMMFCELSNAGLFKPQVFALICLISVLAQINEQSVHDSLETSQNQNKST